MVPIPDVDNLIALSYDPLEVAIIAKVRMNSTTLTTLSLKDTSDIAFLRPGKTSNVLLGNYTPAANPANPAVYVANSAGTVLMQWTGGYASPLQTVATSAPTLTTNLTMAVNYDTTNSGLVATVRKADSTNQVGHQDP